MNATMEADAIPVERISDMWQNWQRANPVEAKGIGETFADMAIIRNFRMAENWLICRVSERINAPKHLIREYILVHSGE